MTIKTIAINDKNMSNGMRNTSKTPLTEKEIEFVKSEIRRIGADEKVFVFNEKNHVLEGTCYNFEELLPHSRDFSHELGSR